MIQTVHTTDSKKRLKILVLIKGLGLGGAERLLVDALPYLDRERFDYEFAYLLPWKDFLVPHLERAEFPVHCLGMRTLCSAPLMLQRLHALQRDRQFDLMHVHLPGAAILARFISRLHGVPVVYTEHNMQERFHPLTRWVNGATYGWNRLVFAVSHEVAASIERCGLHRKTQVVPLLNGVPVERVQEEATQLHALREELGIPQHHLVVGTVAVFRQQKRLEDWLEVASRIAQARDDVTFLLAGHGPEEAILHTKVETLALSDRVRMPGFRPDGRRVLGLVDVFLMTSAYEGLPLALLEAMALGKPVVATAVGGIPEVVSNGAEGWLAPVGAVDELAGRVRQLLDNPPVRFCMGQRGAQKVEEHFHFKDRIKVIERLYTTI